MAESFISELGDRLGGEGVENTVGEHVKILSPKHYQRTDNGVVTNPSIQEAIDNLAQRHHRMIVQIKYIKVNGQTVPRNILCDKTDYTESSTGEHYQFKPIDPKLYAFWYNRGDSFELGHEVSNDPWGDGYPMWITEYQAAQDSNGDWYCTNLNAVRYYNGTLQSKWFNNITDSETGVQYLECQSW